MEEKKEQPKPQKTEAEMNDVEYLEHSQQYFEEEIENAQAQVKILKEQITLLQGDIKVIQADRLKKGAMKVHNQLTMQNRAELNKIKQYRVDLAHVKSILKTLRGMNKK